MTAEPVSEAQNEMTSSTAARGDGHLNRSQLACDEVASVQKHKTKEKHTRLLAEYGFKVWRNEPANPNSTEELAALRAVCLYLDPDRAVLCGDGAGTKGSGNRDQVSGNRDQRGEGMRDGG